MNYTFSTKLGFVELIESGGFVSSVKFTGKRDLSRKLSLNAVKVKNFLDGKRTTLNVPVSPLNASSFQLRVWSLARKIPYGETRTYGWIAGKLKSSPRAVGQALKKNPVPLIIPCHRIVSSDGLGGFSCGVRLKRKLLKLEGALK